MNFPEVSGSSQETFLGVAKTKVIPIIRDNFFGWLFVVSYASVTILHIRKHIKQTQNYHIDPVILKELLKVEAGLLTLCQ